MKYFVNTEEKILGNHDAVFWFVADTFQDGLDKNFALIYDTCVQEFHDNLHTISYDDETGIIVEIDRDGTNFVSTLDETPQMQKLVDLFHNFKEQKERLDEEENSR